MDKPLRLRKLHDPGTVITGTEAEPLVCLHCNPANGEAGSERECIRSGLLIRRIYTE